MNIVVDEIKSLLAKEGVCELLFSLIEQHRHKVNDDDSRAVMKMACDLIVVILTGGMYVYSFLYISNKSTYFKMIVCICYTTMEKENYIGI